MEEHFGSGGNYEELQQHQLQEPQQAQQMQQIYQHQQQSEQLHVSRRSTRVQKQYSQPTYVMDYQEGSNYGSSDSSSENLDMLPMYTIISNNMQIRINQPGENEVLNLWNETMLKLQNDKERSLVKHHVLFYENLEKQLHQIKVNFQQNKKRTQETIAKLNSVAIELLQSPKVLRAEKPSPSSGVPPVNNSSQQQVLTPSPPANDKDTERVLQLLVDELGKFVQIQQRE